MSRGVVWIVIAAVLVVGLLVLSGSLFGAEEVPEPNREAPVSTATSGSDRLRSDLVTGPSPEVRDRRTGRRLDAIPVAWQLSGEAAVVEGTTTADGRLPLPVAGTWRIMSRSQPPAFHPVECAIEATVRVVEVDAIGVARALVDRTPADAGFRLVAEEEFLRLIADEPPTSWFEAVAEVGLPPNRVHGNGAEWDDVPIGQWRVVCAGTGLRRVVPAFEAWRGGGSGGLLTVASRPQDEACPASASMTVDPAGVVDVEVRFHEPGEMIFHLESFVECEYVRIVPRIRRMDEAFEGWGEASVQWEGEPEEATVTLPGLLPADYRVDVYGWSEGELRCGSVACVLRPGASHTFGMDQLRGPYSLTWALDRAGSALWMLENLPADENAVGLEGFAIAGEWDFSSIDRLTVTGLPHLEGVLQLIPAGGATQVLDFDLTERTGY